MTTPPFFTINDTDASTITYTGTSGNDTFTGTSAPELFDGKAGADTYSGGLGDDKYVIENTGDTVSGDSGGQDTVEVWGDFNYTMPSNIEHLVIQGATSRTFTANSDDNIIRAIGGIPSDGIMTVDAGSGNDNIRVSGRDVIATGGTGNDIFRYSDQAIQPPGGEDAPINTITDFTTVEDLIDVSAITSSSDPFSAGELQLIGYQGDTYLQHWDFGDRYPEWSDVVKIAGLSVNNGISESDFYTGF